MSIAIVDQKPRLATKSTSSDMSPVALKFQMFRPLVSAMPSRVKYIQIEIAMIAGAASAASFSTALMPAAVLTTWTMAKSTYQTNQLSKPRKYAPMPLSAIAPR